MDGINHPQSVYGLYRFMALGQKMKGHRLWMSLSILRNLPQPPPSWLSFLPAFCISICRNCLAEPAKPRVAVDFPKRVSKWGRVHRNREYEAAKIEIQHTVVNNLQLLDETPRNRERFSMSYFQINSNQLKSNSSEAGQIRTTKLIAG